MGYKKVGRQLLKLGRQAVKKIGKGGKPWVKKVYQTAFDVIEEELARRGKEAAHTGVTAPPGKAVPKGSRPALPKKAPARPGSRPHAGLSRRSAAAAKSPRARARVLKTGATDAEASSGTEPELVEPIGAGSETVASGSAGSA